MTKLKSLLFSLILLAQGAAMAEEGGNPAIPTKPDLFLALRNGADANQVSRLLKKGADANQLGPEGRRPLMVAAVGGKMDVAQLLLDKGADVNVKSKADVSALALAVNYKHADLVRLLLERGADANVSVQGTPLFITYLKAYLLLPFLVVWPILLLIAVRSVFGIHPEWANAPWSTPVLIAFVGITLFNAIAVPMWAIQRARGYRGGLFWKKAT